MKAKLKYFLEMVRTSFWFLPLVVILVTIGLAFLFIRLDTTLTIEPKGFFRHFLSGGAESARQVLTTIAGAMLGVAGTVFSITLVALTLASSQFGARLLRNFMYDRLNQLVLGTYVATFLYCLLVLKTVKSDLDTGLVPNLSVMVAMILAIANIFLLIIFIHHISISIQADHVISDVNKNLEKSLKKLFPEGLGEEPDEAVKSERLFQNLLITHPFSVKVSSTRNGYLQAIDNEGLMSVANNQSLIISLKHRPGDFLVENETIAEVFSKETCTKEVKGRIRETFVFGRVRTPVQDAEFAIHQLVEIASRALSPGVNDPFTAITCIDKLKASICYLTRAKFPSAWRYDEEGHLRLKVDPIRFSGIMDAAFNQIRQFGKSSPSVTIRLMEALVTINEFAKDPVHRQSISRHAEMVLDAGKEAHYNDNDLKDLKERFHKISKE
ncbi:MAG: DUF2254 domain-containing protein [Bacteroides sp.]|jgi:uncharacterized membrane protein|nr:DUF2254 domain-containing protein [Bacteroides sp.]